ncbi:MAG: DUF4097 family beta strand repeat protein [Clostridia bacterium]|nr:DUF4097 family beta strand repeat protein [Clostridia bacterium]
MRNKTTRWMLVATALLLTGGLLFVGVMSMAKWDFTKISTTKYETSEYEITEAYRDVSLVTGEARVTLLPSEDGRTRVVCHDPKRLKRVASVENGCLTVKAEDTRRWYDYISFFSFGESSVTVYLPAGAYGALSVTGRTGDVSIPSDFSFTSIGVDVSTGDVRLGASATDAVRLKANTGNLSVENATAGEMTLSVTTGKVTLTGVDCLGSVTVTVSTGDAVLTDVRCKDLASEGSTGSLRLQNVVAENGFSLTRGTGDVTFEGCDAAVLVVKTTTGDVTGSLLSEKVFLVTTATGKKEVPETVTGGRCKITTDTGDVRITLAQGK